MFARLSAIVRRSVPLVAQLVPLVKLAWPIILGLAAVVADKSGATDGEAVPVAVGAVIATQVATAARIQRLQAVAAVEAVAQPLRAIDRGEYAEVPTFEFLADPARPGRRRAVAVALHGRKYGLENGPELYFDVLDPSKPFHHRPGPNGTVDLSPYPFPDEVDDEPSSILAALDPDGLEDDQVDELNAEDREDAGYLDPDDVRRTVFKAARNTIRHREDAAAALPPIRGFADVQQVMHEDATAAIPPIAMFVHDELIKADQAQDDEAQRLPYGGRKIV